MSMDDEREALRERREDAIRHVVGMCNRIPGSTTWNAAEFMYDHLASMPAPAPAPATGEAVEMTREEHHLEYLKQMAAYTGPVVSFEFREPYYLASCDACGWVGSSELCGTDSWGDDSDVYCPRCQASGADCGKVAERIPAPQASAPGGEREAQFETAWRALYDQLNWMQGHRALSRYLGRDFAFIANDLIDRAYPGLREGGALERGYCD